MPHGKRAQARAQRADVFLNIPYDQKFENLFLAYIAGINCFGLVPRATLEIPGGARRLDRIWSLLKSCAYSIHDLSRVQLDRTAPSTPRFNMPLELGLSIAWERAGSAKHHWFVFEEVRHRIEKSVSDLSGTDVYVHEGTIAGVFRELGNAFVRLHQKPTVLQMGRVYRALRRSLPEILRRVGADSPFEARSFKDICVAASASADEQFR